MKDEIINKYNVPVPRYTSYPPANYFELFGNEEYWKALEESNHSRNRLISFYLHIPFCRHMCFYCGCNSYPMTTPERVKKYVDALHKEIDIVSARLDKDRLISQIHYGGGSPTALPVEYIKLNDHMFSAFNTIVKPEVAIECHPGYLSHEDWENLANAGFNRMSIGVQDLHEDVLKTVNRRPSQIPLSEIFSILRAHHCSINMDFIYGLPCQSVESFADNIDKAIELQPNRLVTFGYAHVPWVNKRQYKLEEAGLPSNDVKNNMFITAKKRLLEAGYKNIGMDHFVRPDDELQIALNNNQLHRNFQGYCTRRTTGQVYAFGVSGISQFDGAYAQNTKDIDKYINDIEQGNLSITKGYTLSHEERVTKEVIDALMCNYHIDWKDLSERLHLSIEEIKSATAYNKDIMDSFVKDGIIEFDENLLSMTDEGKIFVRAVAASLDKLMINTTKKFSKPI